MNIKQEVMDDDNDIYSEQMYSSWTAPGAIKAEPTKDRTATVSSPVCNGVCFESSRNTTEGPSSIGDEHECFERDGREQARRENSQNDPFYLQAQETTTVCKEETAGPYENKIQDTTQSSTAEDSNLHLEKRQDASENEHIIAEKNPLDERDSKDYMKQEVVQGETVGQATPTNDTCSSSNDSNGCGTSPTNVNRERNGSPICFGEDRNNHNFHCKVLLKSLSSKTNMVTQSENMSVPVTCVKEEMSHSPICNENIPIATNLSSRKGRNRTGSLKCAFCDLEFSLEPNLATHMIIHTGEKPHRCPHCDKSFALGNTLNVHLRTHTGEQPYECSVCDKKFSQHNSLSTHMRTHTGEKPYRCPQCGKRFAIKNSLNMHLRTHTGEKPYHCSACSKRFSQYSSLSTHMRTHSGEKPYQCPQCGKRFALKNYLTLHMRTHTGEKPYQCSVCNKRFSQCCSLSTHMRTHSGEKPFQCPLCFKRFAHKNTMNMHFINGHTLENP